MSKGKKIICALIATAVMIAIAFTFVACKDKTGTTTDYSATNGTYYRFSDGKANKAEFITLADGKWKDEKKDEGTYEISGTEIKIFSEAFGEKAELYSGTIAGGTLTLRLGGLERVYKRDVSEIPVEKGEKVAAPTLKVEDYATICWNKVAGAKGYKLTVDGQVINVGSDKDSYVMENVAVGSHNAKIVALAETEDCNSDEAELNFNFDLYADGNGTEATPYGISTKEQFYNIKEFADKYFVIKKQNSFGGAVFDGDTVEINRKLTAEDGAVIDNVTIKKDLINVNADAVADGLKFTNVINGGAAIVSSNKGTVRNLSVSGQYSGSISYPTAILINSNRGVAENCTVSGTAKGFFSAIVYNGLNGVIRNVTSDLTVEIKSEKSERADRIAPSDMGFVCGGNYGTIASSVAIGSISFDVSYEGNVLGSSGLYTSIGTFVGENGGNISECYSKVNVEGSIYDKFDSIMIGGFAGSNDSEEAVISTSAYAGTFALTVDKNMGSLKIGGFIGTVNEGRVEHCLAANKITITCKKFESNFGWSVSNCKYGGFAGRNAGAISDSYAGGLDISGAEGSTNAFGNMENNGSANGCFVSTDENVALDGDFWFIPRNGSPVLLALSDVKAIEGTCEITRNGNTISWEAVENADYYEYTVNDVRYYAQNTSATLSFTEKGDYTVTVRPCSDTRLPGEKTSISFSVRELVFKVENNGNISEQKYYLGENGSFVVPAFDAVREGYTFAGWTVDDVEYAEGDTVTVVEDLILEPKFNINSYRLVVEIRDKNFQSKKIYDQDVVYNTSLNSVLDTLSWKIENWDENGYSFIGWENDKWYESLPEKMPARSLTVVADYNRNRYTVTLNHNYDGSENIEHTFYYHSDVSYNMSNTPRKGYTFLGWYKDRDCTSGNEMQNIWMPAKNLEFFAKWSLDVFRITVDANGGEYADEIPAEYTVESEDIVLPTPTKTGYTFGGWSVNGEGSYYTLKKGEFVTNLALKAIFTANEYNVNFAYDGVKVSHIVTFDTTRYDGSKTNYPVSEGSKIFPPYQNKTQKYIIRGWYDNPDLKGKPFDFENAKIDRDITLYLKADKIADDVLAAYNAASGAHLGVMRGKLEDISYSGTYVFIAASADGSEDVDFEAFFVAQGKGLNGDSWEMYYTDLVTNEEFVFRKDGPYTAGSTKTYYSTNRNNGVYTLKNGRAYKFKFRMTTSNTIAIDGYFGPKTAFTYPGEGCAMTNEGKFKVAYDSAIGTLPPLSKTGYIFDGWYVEGDETQTAITADTVMRYTNDITLVPKFTLLTSTISFECDGGTLADGSTLEDWVCSVENQTKYLGELPLVKDGYRFMGWYEDNLFTKRIYYIGYSYYPKGTTIYAYFEKLYYINYVFPEEVNQTKDPTETIRTETYSLPTIAVDGYRFMGWYTEETFENEITSIDNPTADATVYAHYEKIYYATFDFGDNGGAWKANSAPATTEYTRLDALDFSNNEVAPPANYQFVGWKINGNEVSINCKEYVIAAGTTADATFTAVYERRSDGILYQEIITNNVSRLKASFPKEKGTLEEDVVIPAYVRWGKYRYLPVQSVFSSSGNGMRNYSINSVTLGSGIEKIEFHAFYGIFANYVYIPATVTEIESYAFVYNTNYQAENMKWGVNQYMNIMYEGAEWIFDDAEWISIYQSFKYNATASFWLLKDEWYRPIANVKNFRLSDTEDIVNFNDGTIGIAKYKGSDTVIDLTDRNVSYVMPGAYLNNTSITEFRIPANVTVGASAFCGCNGVKKIETATDFDIDGAFCDNYCKEKTDDNGEKRQICFYYGPQTNGSVELVSSAETMTYDLSNLKKTIKSVTLSNVTEIKDGLFTDCTYLTEINLTSEKLTNIGANAFAITTTRSTPVNTKMTIASELVVMDSTAFDGNRAISSYVGTSQAYPYIKSYVTATEITVLGTEIQSSAFKQSKFTKVTISSTITSIGNEAFSNCKLQTVVFEEGAQLTTIGGGAFFCCYSLGNFEIPSTVTTIGGGAFDYCPLTSINIPVGVTSIYSDAFINCSYLKSVYITDLGAWCNIAFETAASNPLVGGGTLYLNGEALTDIVVPAEVTELAPFAFTGSKIKSVTISDGVTKIGESAFHGCTSLTSVHIPSSVAAIDKYAFANCTAITAVYITDVNAWSNIQFGVAGSSNPLSYGATLYVNGEALTDLVVAEGATEIKPYVFRGSTIQSVTIPSSVTVIGEGAFDECSNLTSVVFATGSRLTTIGDEAFSSTAIINLVIPATVTTIGNNAFGGAERAPNTTLTSVTFEEGSRLTVMGQKMFYNCTALTSVVLPANLAEIGDYAFYYCSALESIDIPTSVTVIGDSAFGYCSALTSVELPAGLTTIRSGAFYSCGALASVNIPASVTSIGGSAFYAYGITSVSITNLLSWLNIDFANTMSNPLCAKAKLYLNGEELTSIVIPDSVTVIKKNVFAEFAALQSVTLHDNVASIGENAFYGCTSLSSISIPEAVTSISEFAFAKTALQTVTIHNKITDIGNTAFAGCSALTSVVFADGSQLTSIGMNAFSNCSALTSINLPTSVTTLGEYAFRECTSLATVTLGSITELKKNTFYNCTSLVNVTLPSSVTAIGNQAFYGCTKLASVKIPDAVTTIGDQAFYRCRALTNVTISGKCVVASIGKESFLACTSLKEIRFPITLKKVGESAFADCTSMAKITFGASQSSIEFGRYWKYHCPDTLVVKYNVIYA